MASEQGTGGAGVVEVRTEQGVLSFCVRELPVEGEIGLRNQLSALALKRLGPGGLYANLLPALNWMRAKDVGQHADAAVMLQAVAPLIARGEGLADSAVELFRQTPDGVAEELWFRLDHAAHPDVTRAEVRAIVNDANAVPIHVAMLRALDPEKKG